MKLHLIAPFHTVPALEFSHCAFTGKALRFPAMMQARGFRVVEYANEGSEAGAHESVRMLSSAEFQKYFRRDDPSKTVGDLAKIGAPGWKVFNNRLEREMKKRVQAGDIVCHPFGQCHVGLTSLLPHVPHVETGIGYPDAPFGCFRIFESRAWQHWHLGKHGEGKELDRSLWVVPNYYNPSDWHVRDPNADGYEPPANPYVLQFGRVEGIKGVATFVELAYDWREKYPRSPLQFVIAGQGDFAEFDPEESSGIVVLGALAGAERMPLLRDAEAIVAPSKFVEPFGGSVAEALLSGVPALVPAYGAFTETIDGHTNGVHVDDGDWLGGLERTIELGAALEQRRRIQASAQLEFSTTKCGRQYERIFDVILRQWGLPRARVDPPGGGATGPRPAPELDAAGQS